ncbi:MAG TPA: GspMb/PilO family protein [Bryobacteraceae bacterium]|nr:GspMb/PilO family protein [Bryobacteraceae bacterium]
MNFGTLERKHVYLVVASLLLLAVLKYGVYGDRPAGVAAPTESVPVAEKRLEILRVKAAGVPGKETVLKTVSTEVASREKGVLAAETAAQAQAQLMEIIHRIAAANGFDARGAEELREARPLGSDYGEVSVTESFTCQIDQFVNFLAQLANEPLILATNSIHINGLNDKKKSIQVRLSLSGVVPRKLVPVKKVGTF